MPPRTLSTLGMCLAFLNVNRIGHDNPDLAAALEQASTNIRSSGREDEPTPAAAITIETSTSPETLLARFRRIDPYCTLESVGGHLDFERCLHQAAEALLLTSFIDSAVRDELEQLGTDYTLQATTFAVHYFLTQGDSARLRLERVPELLGECDGGLPGKWLWMELETVALEKVFGRSLNRFPADPFALSGSALPGYLNCVRALTGLVSNRILAFTELEEKARNSMLDLFETRYKEGLFQTEEVLEPAYRFRPITLPFETDPDTAMEYYRTEQKLREQIVRITSQACLDSRYGLRMIFESEAFTVSLIEYARLAGETFWEGDRPRLYTELPRLVNHYPGTARRLAFLRALWLNLPPQDAGNLGISGLLETIRALQTKYETLDSLKTLGEIG